MGQRGVVGVVALAVFAACEAPPPDIQPVAEPARFEVDPGVDLGDVPVDTEAIGVLRLANRGGEPLLIEDVRLSANTTDGFRLPDLPQLPLTLLPGAERALSIRYVPREDESALESLLFTTDEPGRPLVQATVRAEGLAPRLALDPLSVGFDAQIDCPEAQSLTLENRGRAPLTVAELRLDDLSNSAGFVVGGPATPFSLAPGATTEIPVGYGASDAVLDLATLAVVSDDPLRPVVEVGLEGTAADVALPTVEQWSMPIGGPVDILWVIDSTHPDMATAQTRLVAGAPGWFAALDAAVLDYHVGIVTTDPVDGGVLQGPIPILTPQVPDRVAAFQVAVSVGGSAGGPPQGLGMAMSALSAPNAGPGGPNAGFLRDAVDLRVILVSSQADGSLAIESGDPLDYADWFRAVKTDEEGVSVSALSGRVDGCAGPLLSADPAPRIDAVVQELGGFAGSICAPDWTGVLAALAEEAQVGPPSLPLTWSPRPATLSVHVSSDGGANFVPLTFGWGFDPERDMVQLDEGILGPTAVVEVRYQRDAPCSP